MNRELWNEMAASVNVFFLRKLPCGEAEPQAALFPLVGTGVGLICTLGALVGGILFGREAAALAAIVFPLGLELMTDWHGLKSLTMDLALRFRKDGVEERLAEKLDCRKEITPFFLFVSVYLLRALAFGLIALRSPSVFVLVFTGAYLIRSGVAACAAEELEPLLEIPEEKRRFPLIVTGGVFLLTGILSLHLRILAGGVVLYLLALLIGRIQRNAIVRRTGRASLRIFETDGYAAETILLLAGMAVA